MHDQMIGQTIASSDQFLNDHSRAAIGFARGIARATLFGLTNPEAAVRIHWKAYPETKPQGVDEAKALKEAIHVFNSRFELQRVDHREDKRYGYASRAQWEKLKQIYTEQGVTKGTADVAQAYTDKLVGEINGFDKASITKAAKEWK
jgi:NitT/TauT family transport system substrate-binding protein